MKTAYLLLILPLFCLLQMGASCESELNRMVPKGPLHKAAKEGNIEEINRLVLQENHAVDSRDDTGNTPMHMAAYQGQLQAIKRLAELGADLNARDYTKGRTPLLVAAAQSFWTQDYEEILNTLIDLGAELNARDHRYNQTALHRAAYYGIRGNVRTLLKRGANKNLQNSVNRTPAEVVADRISSVEKSSSDKDSVLLKHLKEVQSMLN